jgi:NADH-quinone oxidoreductase subunit F
VLTAAEADVPMDFTSLAAAGSMLGSAAVIVMDEDTDMVPVLESIMGFFKRESCGQCTPCREGTAWSHTVVRRILAGDGKPEDIDCLLDISRNMNGTTICPLGQAAAGALATIIEKFRGEFEARTAGRGEARTTERPA